MVHVYIKLAYYLILISKYQFVIYRAGLSNLHSEEKNSFYH